MNTGRSLTTWLIILVASGMSGCSDQSSTTRAVAQEDSVPPTEKAAPGKALEVIPTMFRVSTTEKGQDAAARANVPSAAPAGGAARRPKAEDWSLEVGDDGGVQIRCHGVPVIQTGYVFFSNPTMKLPWIWGKPNFKAGARGANGYPISVDISGFKATGDGIARETGPGQIEYEYRILFDKTFPQVLGGGIHWTFKLDSPVFRSQKPADPTLLPDQRGWSWQVGDDPSQSISVVFDPPAAKVFYEKNQKNGIRTYFVADSVERGQKTIRFKVSLPPGGKIKPSESERLGPERIGEWHHDAPAWDAAPVDLSFLNKADRPAGKRGRVKADGDRMVFEDGSPARFWGGNLTAFAIFGTPKEHIPQSARRMAQLGYNLMRIHHHDSNWVNPNIFDKTREDTQRLDPKSLDAIDYWVKCLEDEGIYVWLDIHVGRVLGKKDPVSEGLPEILKNHGGEVKGYNYFNDDIQSLMKSFQKAYLGRVNPYTRLAYKDDPSIVALLLTNENDLSHHFGNMMLPPKNNHVHTRIFTRETEAFAESTGLPANKLGQTWLAGPSKIFLNSIEHRFNRAMIDDLRKMGIENLVATTNSWGYMPAYSLPSLTDGDIIDAHSYGFPGSLETNPRYEPNYLSWIAMSRVQGKPLTITEWSVEYPHRDRFISPLYVAAIASLQGWDAPMQFCYTAGGLDSISRLQKFSTSFDPAFAMMPAAALIYRLGYVSPARESYCLQLDGEKFFERELTPQTSAAIRTLAERSKLSVGMPAVKALPWLKPSTPGPGVKVINDPDQDFIPEGESVYRSDTGELERDWVRGTHKIDTPKAQAISGWIGGNTYQLSDSTIRVDSPNKAAVSLVSVDNQPLTSSRLILITAIARAKPRMERGHEVGPMVSEPVSATISLGTKVEDLDLLALGMNGRVVGRSTPKMGKDGLVIHIPGGRGTHWFVLKSRGGDKPKSAAASAKR